MILDELHTYINAQAGLETLSIYKPDLEDGDGAPDFQLALRPTGGLPPVRTLDDTVGSIVDPIAIQHLMRSRPVGHAGNVASAYQDAWATLWLVYEAVDLIMVKRRTLTGVIYEYAEILQPPAPLSLADEKDRWLFSFNAIYHRERT